VFTGSVKEPLYSELSEDEEEKKNGREEKSGKENRGAKGGRVSRGSEVGYVRRVGQGDVIEGRRYISSRDAVRGGRPSYSTYRGKPRSGEFYRRENSWNHVRGCESGRGFNRGYHERNGSYHHFNG
jgi:hypothetical protein